MSPFLLAAPLAFLFLKKSEGQQGERETSHRNEASAQRDAAKSVAEAQAARDAARAQFAPQEMSQAERESRLRFQAAQVQAARKKAALQQREDALRAQVAESRAERAAHIEAMSARGAEMAAARAAYDALPVISYEKFMNYVEGFRDRFTALAKKARSARDNDRSKLPAAMQALSDLGAEYSEFLKVYNPESPKVKPRPKKKPPTPWEVVAAAAFAPVLLPEMLKSDADIQREKAALMASHDRTTSQRERGSISTDLSAKLDSAELSS